MHTVNVITMSGTRITAHRNRLPVRRFVSSKFRESQEFSKLWSSVDGIGADVLNPPVLDG